MGKLHIYFLNQGGSISLSQRAHWFWHPGKGQEQWWAREQEELTRKERCSAGSAGEASWKVQRLGGLQGHQRLGGTAQMKVEFASPSAHHLSKGWRVNENSHPQEKHIYSFNGWNRVPSLLWWQKVWSALLSFLNTLVVWLQGHMVQQPM